MKSCCEHHADTLPHGCRQGRYCPEHTRSSQEAEYLWTRNLDQCARSGQVDSRQIAAHIAAGEMDGIGVEAADAARVTGAPIVTTELRPVREPFDWSAFARWGAAVALCVLWTVLVILR
jgi:hypothetical protein